MLTIMGISYLQLKINSTFSPPVPGIFINYLLLIIWLVSTVFSPGLGTLIKILTSHTSDWSDYCKIIFYLSFVSLVDKVVSWFLFIRIDILTVFQAYVMGSSVNTPLQPLYKIKIENPSKPWLFHNQYNLSRIKLKLRPYCRYPVEQKVFYRPDDQSCFASSKCWCNICKLLTLSSAIIIHW